ncbi:MAG: N-acetyl-gamma-glutamyl-phosphate reductase, partial [Proteobacteria bacterium]
MKAAIIGAAGYAGGELLRLLLGHPIIEGIQALSRSQAGKPVFTVHEDLFASELMFTSELNPADVVFLCGDHGQSMAILDEFAVLAKARYVIDLAADFRDGREGFVYGLNEVFTESIRTAHKVANPGCFATALQLALAPLASAGLMQSPVHITAITGSTGAGQKLQKTSHFSARQQNMSTYKAFDHQ